jgi:hypothetical protein
MTTPEDPRTLLDQGRSGHDVAGYEIALKSSFFKTGRLHRAARKPPEARFRLTDNS